MLYRAFRPLLGAGIAALVASFWAPGTLTIVAAAIVIVALLVMTVDRRRSGATRGTKLDPLLRDGPLLGSDVGSNSQDVRTVDEFAGYARSEGMTEFGEALGQERLRAQPNVERDIS